MKACVKFLKEELEIAKKIQNDETWLEGERRHCVVNKDDAEVRKHTDEVIMSHIDEMESEVKHKWCTNCGECKNEFVDIG